MNRRLVTFIAAVAAVVAAMTANGPASADSVEEFYRGKTVELIVGFSPGGGYDTYARTLARHMGQYIPGSPEIVPKNMPGAGGLVALNHLYNVAPKDGTVIGTFGRGLAVEPLLGREGANIEFDATRISWLGSVNNEVGVCVSWHTSPVRTWEDVLETELVVGTEGPGSDYGVVSSALHNILGGRLKAVAGYTGSNEILLAIERGELDGLCGWSWSSATSRRPEWIEGGKVNILVQIALQKHPDLPDIPLIMDLAQTDEQRQMLRLIFSRQSMGRPFAAPPGIPEEHASALREAFEATMKDPRFLADAEQAGLEVNWISGEAIADLLASVYQTPQPLVSMAAEATRE